MRSLEIRLAEIRILIEGAQSMSGQSWNLQESSLDEEACRQARQALLRVVLGVDLDYI